MPTNTQMPNEHHKSNVRRKPPFRLSIFFMEIFINDLQNKRAIDPAYLEKIALHLLHEMQCDERCEVSIALVDDQEMRQLNLQYRHIDKPTDVLSFALQEADEPPIVSECAEQDVPILLGDVILSTETTQRQAEERGHPFEQELSILLIHGLLHLLGYDHQTDEDAEIMEPLELELLKKIVNNL